MSIILVQLENIHIDVKIVYYLAWKLLRHFMASDWSKLVYGFYLMHDHRFLWMFEEINLVKIDRIKKNF